jgi:hypothetical protein
MLFRLSLMKEGNGYGYERKSERIEQKGVLK